MKAKAHRLPKEVRPVAYDVDLSTHPGRPDFSGTLSAELDVTAATDRIELHAKDLTLAKAQVRFDGATHELSVQLDSEREIAKLHSPVRLEPGRVTLLANFSGKLHPSMHGLYLAQDGDERAICTQCEATDARAIFPCFDEPEFKARIRWTIRTPTNLVALANGPLESVLEENGQKVWRFAATAPVSSYLAALVVGDFEGTEPTVSGTTPLRVFATTGKREQARFAHAFTEKLFPWFEEYFDVPYPYSKYDQVAVPGFDAGAMENVGLVLFRQNLLLMDPRSASWNQEKMIARVIAHELAHMWFGNLVTMKWWDDLWLNEAFAEWFAHKGVHAVDPSYQVWNDFQGDKNRALIDDALPTTHPIWAPVETPGQALEMFDVITYQKGCAVMRMLENFLGEEAFRAGIRTYMKAFAEKNAEGRDLWEHLAAASARPVAELMKSWIAQSGFPLVSLELDQSHGRASVALRQRRFFSSPGAAAKENDQLWNVPMVVRFADDDGEKEHRFIFSTADHVESLPVHGHVRWVYGNAHEIGFYRVRTGGDAATTLLDHGPVVLSAVEQMGFIEDQWALVRNATGTLSGFLPVLEAFSGSRDHNVVRALTDRLGTLDLLLEHAGREDARKVLWKRVADMFGPQLAELGYEAKSGEPQNDAQRRALVIHALGSLARVPEVVSRCETMAKQEQADARSVDPNLAGTFVAIAAKFGGADRYDSWMRTYLDRKSKGAPPQDSLRYLYTLAAFRSDALTERTIAQVDGGVVPQEAVGAVTSQLLSTRHGQRIAWDYLTKNWHTLKERVGDMGVSRVVEAVGHLPAELRPDIVSFFQSNPPTGAERALARALENLDQREELRARVTPELLAYLGMR